MSVAAHVCGRSADADADEKTARQKMIENTRKMSYNECIDQAEEQEGGYEQNAICVYDV